ncbi:MAG: hypothetical protein AAFS10_14540 [Myxococcota bacterium]
MVGPYYYMPDTSWGHRIPVRWEDVTLRTVAGKSWRQPLARLTRPRFERVQQASPSPSQTMPQEGKHLEYPFTEHCFELLDALAAEPTKQLYLAHKASFRRHIEWPFQQVLFKVGELLPVPIQEVMETQEGLFGRFLKNDFGRGGTWDHYWGAFYPKGGKRIASAQLYVGLIAIRLSLGLISVNTRSISNSALCTTAKNIERCSLNCWPKCFTGNNWRGAHARLPRGLKGLDQAGSNGLQTPVNTEPVSL